jgi:hypothetical protein
MITKKLNRKIKIVEECLIHFDYANCICCLFGGSTKDATSLAEALDWLQCIRDQLVQDGDHVQGDTLQRLLRMRTVGDDYRNFWKENWPIKILCSDDELRRLAMKVKGEGVVSFSKADFDEQFDLSDVDPFWRSEPDYTRVILGGGFRISSPARDMFYAMCHCHDRAVATGRELGNLRRHVANADDVDEADRLNLAALHHLEVIQTVINACVFVEAFVNSVAHAYRCKAAASLSPEVDRFLRERAIDKQTGGEREKFVSLQDKLYHWVQLVSPRRESFDKGANPYQAFQRIQEYRDSIVHLSATKVETYHRIDLPVAIQAANVALEVVEAICRYIAPNAAVVAYPKWLAKRQSDGLFHLSARIALIPEGGSGSDVK